MIITEQILNQGLSINGGWNIKQLKALGLETTKFNKGWKQELIGLRVSEQQIKRFLELKNTHLEMTGNLWDD